MFSSTASLALWLSSFFLVAVNGQAGSISGKCSGQTCYIAALGASTSEPYKLQGGKKPTGGSASGDRCIKEHYKKLGLGPPAGLRVIDFMPQNNIQEFYGPLESQQAKNAAEVTEALAKRQLGACAANTLLFARGTTEIGVMGSTVGPALQSGLTGSGWSVQGISYSADLSGIYCLGLAGGVKCVDQINALAKKCPTTNIVLSGYSQGAMVARICAAWAGEAAKKQIKGLALFGDPFNGADVKGISQSKVKTWCNNGDGVCKGDFSIGVAHLSYAGTSTGQAVTWIKGIVKG